MDKDRWQRVEELFEQALARTPDTRQAFLRAQCGDDQALLEEVEQLLSHHLGTEQEGFLSSPAEIAQVMRGETADTDPFIGRELGPYQIVKRLGGGGMGEVYLAARQAEFRQQVAIKLLRGSIASGDLLQRFKAEMQILAVLSKNEAIAALIDAGSTEEGLPYFVMEYVEGEPIDAYCDHHRHSLQERIVLFRQICAAVHFAHWHMVIHRDLKTGNILVRTDGAPKLIDFGIAKLVSPELAGADMVTTLSAQNYMTAAYASPEQARGENLTPASDVYSLGMVLYELLAGQRPYDLEGLGHQEQIERICEQDPPPPSRAFEQTGSDPARIAMLRGTTAKKLRGTLHGDLDAIVLKAIRKEPQRRYDTAAALSDDLGRFLEHRPVEARPLGPVLQVGRWSRRNPFPAALLLAVLLILAGGFWQLSRLSDQLVQAAAIEGAGLESETLAIVQDFYARSVVEKVKHLVPVTHRYAMHEGAIPVPATFTIELGDRIRQSEAADMIARLYSSYPFPHRENGGPRDEFEVQALEALGRSPEQPFYRFETFEGRPSLRYATGRVMRQACVDCHNKHPDSPKKNWKVGDLRGVLEIIRPLDLDIAKVQTRLRETFAFVLGVSLLLLGLSAWFLRGGRKA